MTYTVENCIKDVPDANITIRNIHALCPFLGVVD
jgi:hypothetical protein